MIENQKRYDLEERTLRFAKEIRNFTRSLPKTMANIEDGKQLIRSSGSVGANYIEANESFSRKDFAMKIKICRKEAKESSYWLKLITAQDVEKEKMRLTNEAIELTKIFGSMVEKLK